MTETASSSLKLRVAALEQAFGQGIIVAYKSSPLVPRVVALETVLHGSGAGSAHSALAPRVTALERELARVLANIGEQERMTFGELGIDAWDDGCHAVAPRLLALERAFGTAERSEETEGGIVDSVAHLARFITEATDTLSRLEEAVKGRSWVSGPLRVRVAELETAVDGRVGDGAILSRLAAMQKDYPNLQLRIGAIETDLRGDAVRSGAACLVSRVEAAEVAINGRASSESLRSRIRTMELEMSGQRGADDVKVRRGPVLPRVARLENEAQQSPSWYTKRTQVPTGGIAMIATAPHVLHRHYTHGTLTPSAPPGALLKAEGVASAESSSRQTFSFASRMVAPSDRPPSQQHIRFASDERRCLDVDSKGIVGVYG